MALDLPTQSAVSLSDTSGMKTEDPAPAPGPVFVPPLTDLGHLDEQQQAIFQEWTSAGLSLNLAEQAACDYKTLSEFDDSLKRARVDANDQDWHLMIVVFFGAGDWSADRKANWDKLQNANDAVLAASGWEGERTSAPAPVSNARAPGAEASSTPLPQGIGLLALSLHTDQSTLQQVAFIEHVFSKVRRRGTGTKMFKVFTENSNMPQDLLVELLVTMGTSCQMFYTSLGIHPVADHSEWEGSSPQFVPFDNQETRRTTFSALQEHLQDTRLASGDYGRWWEGDGKVLMCQGATDAATASLLEAAAADLVGGRNELDKLLGPATHVLVLFEQDDPVYCNPPLVAEPVPEVPVALDCSTNGVVKSTRFCLPGTMTGVEFLRVLLSFYDSARGSTRVAQHLNLFEILNALSEERELGAWVVNERELGPWVVNETAQSLANSLKAEDDPPCIVIHIIDRNSRASGGMLATENSESVHRLDVVDFLTSSMSVILDMVLDCLAESAETGLSDWRAAVPVSQTCQAMWLGSLRWRLGKFSRMLRPVDVPLTTAQDDRLAEIMRLARTGHQDECAPNLACLKVSNCVRMLSRGNRLGNDEVDAWMQLLCHSFEHVTAYTSFFSQVLRSAGGRCNGRALNWARKHLLRMPLTERSISLIPLHIDPGRASAHFQLIVVRWQQRRVEFYCPLHWRLYDWIWRELTVHLELIVPTGAPSPFTDFYHPPQLPPTTPFKLFDMSRKWSPRQLDTTSCGIHLNLMGECICRNMLPTYTGAMADVQAARRRQLTEMLEWRLIRETQGTEPALAFESIALTATEDVQRLALERQATAQSADAERVRLANIAPAGVTSMDTSADSIYTSGDVALARRVIWEVPNQVFGTNFCLVPKTSARSSLSSLSGYTAWSLLHDIRLTYVLTEPIGDCWWRAVLIGLEYLGLSAKLSQLDLSQEAFKRGRTIGSSGCTLKHYGGRGRNNIDQLVRPGGWRW